MARTIADQQILTAALRVITQEGYAGATTRQIATEAGINEVTLFRRFGSKKNLLIAAMMQEAEHFNAAAIEYTGDLEGDLLRVVQFYQKLVEERGQLIAMLWSEAPRQPDLLEVMQTAFTISAKIAELLVRYQQAGKLISEPPMEAFTALVGPLLVRAILQVVEPASFAPVDATIHVHKYLQGRSTRP